MQRTVCTQTTLWQQDREHARRSTACAAGRYDIFDVDLTEVSRPASRCGAYDLVTSVQRLHAGRRAAVHDYTAASVVVRHAAWTKAVSEVGVRVTRDERLERLPRAGFIPDAFAHGTNWKEAFQLDDIPQQLSLMAANVCPRCF